MRIHPNGPASRLPARAALPALLLIGCALAAQVHASQYHGALQTPAPLAVVTPLQTVQAGHVPQALVSVDFDHDGRQDLAVVAAFSDSLTLLRNTGGGYLAHAQTIDVGASPLAPNDDLPHDIAVGDLDGDGYNDLVVVNLGDFRRFNDGSLAVLYGRAQGGFTPPEFVSLIDSTGLMPFEPRAVTLFDVTQNGLLDLLVGNYGDGSFSLIANRGRSFHTPVTYAAGAATFGPNQLAAANLDPDTPGFQVFLANDRELTMATVLGNGLAGSHTLATGPANGRFSDVAVGDFDRNGLPDVVAINTGINELLLWPNLSPGPQVAPPLRVSLGNAPQPSALALGDFNQDGRQDLAVSLLGGNQVALMLNQGSDGLVRADVVFHTAREPRDLVAWQANDDGALDLATANSADDLFPDNSDVSVLLNPLPQQNTGAPRLGGMLSPSPDVLRGQLVGADLKHNGAALVATRNGRLYRFGRASENDFVELCQLTLPSEQLQARVRGIAFRPRTGTVFVLDGEARLWQVGLGCQQLAPSVGDTTITPLARLGAVDVAYHPQRDSLFALGPRRLVELMPHDSLLAPAVRQVHAIDGAIDPVALAVDRHNGVLHIVSDTARLVYRMLPNGQIVDWVSLHAPLPPGFRTQAALVVDGGENLILFGADPLLRNRIMEVEIGLPAAMQDIDGDGIPDEAEGWPPAAGQTHRLLPDSDRDGLPDGAEDLNLNGRRDPGETDARNWDSDSDRIPDGVEVRILGTNPLDPTDPGPGVFVDRDNDWLPEGFDADDRNPDQDGDGNLDGYEYMILGPGAERDPNRSPHVGDVNLDGAAGNLDALIIQALFLNSIGPRHPIFMGTGSRHADVNGDGDITNLDALVIQAAFLNVIPGLPLQR